MKKPLMEFLRSCRFPLMIAFGTVPVSMIILAYASEELLAFSWVFPAAYVVLAMLCGGIRGKKGLLWGLVSVLSLIGLGGLFALRYDSLLVLLASVLYSILLLWGLANTAWYHTAEVMTRWYWICIVIHVGTQLLTFSRSYEGDLTLDPAAPWCLACFFVFALLAMLSMNQSCMAGCGDGRQSASNSMRRKNILLVLGVFVIALLVTLIPSAASVLGSIIGWAIYALMWLLSIFSLGESAGGSGDGTGQDMQLPDVDEKEQSWFGELISAVAVVAGVILTVVVLILAAVWAFRKLRKLFAYLLTRLGEYVSGATEDYVDEITDTRERDTDEHGLLSRIKRRRRVINERALAPGERIRYRYLRLMLKHPEWTAGSTAREKLPQELAPIYERVRYDSHEATGEEAAQFISGIKRV